jgi:2-aminoadipate transaminase
MTIDFEPMFSDLAGNMKASEIRELLKLTANPDIISFAGGLPNPKAFPIEELKEITVEVLKEHGPDALQYGATEGVSQFRNFLKEEYAKDDEFGDNDELVVTNGSQQALDLLGKILLDKGDKLVAEAPTYLGGSNAFKVYGADVVHVEMDDDGMRIDELEDTLRRLSVQDMAPKFAYMIPTFQNPAGVTMPESRRRKFLDVVYQYDDLLVIEDDPYGRLRFEGQHQRSLKSLDTEGRVLHMKTLSKVLVPGFRIGVVSGPADLVHKLVFAKQSADLCSPAFNPFVAWKYMSAGYIDKQLKLICEMYNRKRDIMLKSMDEHMPEGVRWTRPLGGMFLWATIKGGINTDELFFKAIKKNVAFVVGRPFYTDGRGTDSMRINFSYSEDDIIDEGVRRLAETIREEQANHKRKADYPAHP